MEDNYPNYRMPLTEVFPGLFACFRKKKDEEREPLNTEDKNEMQEMEDEITETD